MKFKHTLTNGTRNVARILVPLFVTKDEWESIKTTARAEGVPVRTFLKSALVEGIEDGHQRNAEEG